MANISFFNEYSHGAFRRLLCLWDISVSRPRWRISYGVRQLQNLRQSLGKMAPKYNHSQSFASKDWIGLLEDCLDWLKFWISFFFSGVNSYAKYGKEVDFPISLKNLRGPVAGNKLQRCALLSCQSDTLYFITTQGFIQQTWIKPFQIIPDVHLAYAKKRHNFKSKNLKLMSHKAKCKVLPWKHQTNLDTE